MFATGAPNIILGSGEIENKEKWLVSPPFNIQRHSRAIGVYTLHHQLRPSGANHLGLIDMGVTKPFLCGFRRYKSVLGQRPSFRALCPQLQGRRQRNSDPTLVLAYFAGITAGETLPGKNPFYQAAPGFDDAPTTCFLPFFPSSIPSLPFPFPLPLRSISHSDLYLLLLFFFPKSVSV